MGCASWTIPADAAQYDTSCAANGTELQASRNKADRSSFSGDHRPQPHLLESAGLAERFKPKPK